MKAGVLVFPGSNCDHDCYHVLKHVIGCETEFIWHKEKKLGDINLVVVPGGFSYGDYLRCGAIASHSPVMDAVKKFASKGGIVIGICNGFQILTESGLLPGALMRNSNLKFICRHLHISVENADTPFTSYYSPGEVLNIPIAHMDGNYFIDEKGLQQLKENNQIVFKYCSSDGDNSKGYNPNGSLENIAGIINKEGNVLGMMPHPERAAESVLGSDNGLLIFKSIKSYLKGVL